MTPAEVGATLRAHVDEYAAQYQQAPYVRSKVGDWVTVNRGGRDEPAEILSFEVGGAVVRFGDGRERFVTKWAT